MRSLVLNHWPSCAGDHFVSTFYFCSSAIGLWQPIEPYGKKLESLAHWQCPDSCHQILWHHLKHSVMFYEKVKKVPPQKKRSQATNFLPVFTKIGTDDLWIKPHKSWQMDFWYLRVLACQSQSKLVVSLPNNVVFMHKTFKPHGERLGNLSHWFLTSSFMPPPQKLDKRHQQVKVEVRLWFYEKVSHATNVDQSSPKLAQMIFTPSLTSYRADFWFSEVLPIQANLLGPLIAACRYF